MKTIPYLSKNNIPTRFTYERLCHIISNHPEMIRRIQDIGMVITAPDYICEGEKDEYIALKKGKTYFIVVVYKEDLFKNDGFIITAFITRKIDYYLKKKIVWKNRL